MPAAELTYRNGFGFDLAEYEAAMFPRSESFYADAREILELCLGDRAPFGLIDFLTAARTL